MWRFTALLAFASVSTALIASPRTGDELVTSVLNGCADMGCVKENVLGYLDTFLDMQTDARSVKNIDQAIFKRAARIFKTHEFRFKLPQTFFDGSEVVYNPRSGLDVSVPEAEERGLGLKKKLLLPALLLFKLKMKALMPIFMALIGIKALKALILSKLAIAIVLGFVIYQLLGKSGMPMAMPMSMAPIEAPMPVYGPPSTSPPSSYEPGWEPSGSGPYARVWTGGSQADPSQSLAYSAYYPGSGSSSTNRP